MEIDHRVAAALDRAGWHSLRSIARAERFEGSEVAETFDIRLIVKRGPRAIIEPAALLYQRLRDTLGPAADAVFPRTLFLPPDGDDVAVLCLEPIPGDHLEAVMLGIGSLAQRVGQASPLVDERRNRVQQMLEKVCAHLGVLHGHRAEQTVEWDALRNFVVELEGALRENLRRAELAIVMPAVSTRSCFWETGWATLAHRDCSVVNIVGDQSCVKLIDPRAIVPNGITGAAFASPAIDLVALTISLERKRFELRAMDADVPIDREGIVVDAMTRARECGAVNDCLIALCEAVVYTAYAACRCAYCLAPERRPLYDHMRERAGQAIAKLHAHPVHGGAP